MQTKMNEKIKQIKSELFKMTKIMFENPELGLEEEQSARLLVSFLKKEGFEITFPYIMPTGFKAVFDSKKEGPSIGYLCEYDALPSIGHGCGHNMIGVMSVGAAVALKEVITSVGGKIVVLGTPAEENFGGKVKFKEKKAFEEIDVALMLHPASYNGVGARSSALIPIRFDFEGISAHGAKPYNGASALDAAVLTYQGINMLRQFAKSPSFIHGIIKDGGKAANIIPSHASLEYYFRADTLEYAAYLEQRAKEIALGAAEMTRTKVSFSNYEETYDDTKINYALAKRLKKIMEQIGLTDVSDVIEEVGSSTDVGACSKVCPTIQGTIKIVDECVNAHSKEFANATVNDKSPDILEKGAQALSLLGLAYLEDDEFRKEVIAEFKE